MPKPARPPRPCVQRLRPVSRYRSAASRRCSLRRRTNQVVSDVRACIHTRARPHTHTRTCIYAHVRAHAHICTQTDSRTHTHTHIHAHARPQTHTHTHTPVTCDHAPCTHALSLSPSPRPSLLLTHIPSRPLPRCLILASFRNDELLQPPGRRIRRASRRPSLASSSLSRCSHPCPCLLRTLLLPPRFCLHPRDARTTQYASSSDSTAAFARHKRGKWNAGVASRLATARR